MVVRNWMGNGQEGVRWGFFADRKGMDDGIHSWQPQIETKIFWSESDLLL